jgi:hypothetical protein
MKFDEDHEAELTALRVEEKMRRAYLGELVRNPDCRDPDHPGCNQCTDADDE